MFFQPINHKNALLEFSARDSGLLQPEYFHFEYGPPHAKVFLCICSFQRKTTSHQGRTKIEAEQLASEEMLNILSNNHIHSSEDKKISATGREIGTNIDAIKETLQTDLQFDVLSLYGDTLLRYCIVRYLFDRYSIFREGTLTRITSEALRAETRASVAEALGLHTAVRTEVTPRTLAQTLSALIGKIATVEGENACADFVQQQYKTVIDLSVVHILTAQLLDNNLAPAYTIETTLHNYKNELLEYAQQHRLDPPTYALVSRSGEDHAPIFTAACHFKHYETVGQGKTRKSAEQEATGKMLTYIKQTNAATTRHIGESSYHHSSIHRVKRFKAPALKVFKKSIGWMHFNSLDDLQATFTHPSKNPDIHYQRLEFLGDALVKKMLFSYIIAKYPDLQDKGMVSAKMDQLVSEETQAAVSLRLELDQHIFADTEITDSMRSDVLEALVAAIFLDAEKNKINRSEMYMIVWFKREIEAIFGSPHKRSSAQFSSNPQSFLNTRDQYPAHKKNDYF